MVIWTWSCGCVSLVTVYRASAQEAAGYVGQSYRRGHETRFADPCWVEAELLRKLCKHLGDALLYSLRPVHLGTCSWHHVVWYGLGLRGLLRQPHREGRGAKMQRATWLGERQEAKAKVRGDHERCKRLIRNVLRLGFKSFSPLQLQRSVISQI